MKTRTAALAFLLAFVCGYAQAAKQDVGEFTIDMPAAFQLLNPQKPDEHTTVIGYVVDSATPPKPAVMIFVRENADQDAAELKPDEVLAVSRKLAADMLEATAKRRDEFQSSEPREIRIAGLPAVETEWTGKVGSMATSGRLFVIISGRTAHFFHVMGAAPPTPDMLAAIEAVKGLKKEP